jgi:hypothetical protein
MEERRGAYRDFVGKAERKRQVERTRRRWECNIKMEFKNCDGHIDRIDLV